jgi:hypothetical protein
LASPADEQEQNPRRIHLQRAIDSLPPGYRTFLVLRDIDGYEYHEIAELVGCSLGNTKSQVHKARMRLRHLLRAAPPELVAYPAAVFPHHWLRVRRIVVLHQIHPAAPHQQTASSSGQI